MCATVGTCILIQFILVGRARQGCALSMGLKDENNKKDESSGSSEISSESLW